MAKVCFIKRYTGHSSLQTKSFVRHILKKYIFLNCKEQILRHTLTFPAEKDLMLQMLGAAHNDSENIRIKKVI